MRCRRDPAFSACDAQFWDARNVPREPFNWLGRSLGVDRIQQVATRDPGETQHFEFDPKTNNGC